MSKIDGASELYDLSNKLTHYLSLLFLFCFFLPFLLLFAPENTSLHRTLLIFQCVLTVTYVIGKAVDQECLFFEAENLRRKLWLDNGFNSRVSKQSTQEYYNNQMPPSFIRLALDSYESCFFTVEILKKGIGKQTLKFIASIVIWVIVCLYQADFKLVLLIIQTIFSGSVFVTFIEHITCFFRLSQLKNRFFTEFFTIGIKKKEQLFVLFHCVMDYECWKSYYHIRLDSKIFNKYNNVLSEEWEAHISKIPKINNRLLNISFSAFSDEEK